MHVGLNLIFLVPGETGGMEVYARELLQRLDAAARDASAVAPVRFTAFVNREAAGGGPRGWGAGIEEVVVPVNARDRKQWVWGEQRHLPKLAAGVGCDIVHSLASTAPLHGRFTRITTIHDLNYKLVPEAHFGVRGKVMGLLVPAAARRSHRIVVDAASTRDDLVAHLGTDPGKVDVVPLGVTAGSRVALTPEAELRRSLDLGDRSVVLSVSAKRPHKNLLRLLDAHAALGDGRPILVIPGYPTEHEGELRARADVLGTLSDVRFPAWLEAADLEGLYALAEAFVFPSLYEGFGLPVLEAMARGVPVATSGRASLAEVAGDAALLFDPESVEEIRGAMVRLLEDGALRDALRTAGLERARSFTWERTAALTLATYARVLPARQP